jgi:hypothetical protein
MKIKLHHIKVKDLFEGYLDSGDDGVVGYGGILDIRPPYQREFVYDLKKSEEVIHTILKGFPLNIMYWVKKDDNNYEILDGQQRTLSICKYLNHDYEISLDGHKYYWDSLPDEDYNRIMDYELMVYICEGTNKEKREWFEIVNIGGEVLTPQELRNATYTGPWLSDAKRYFSKRNCPAYGLGSKFIVGDPNRQQLIEKALKGICDLEGTDIDEYMSRHQHDTDADELWQYYQDVIHWVQKVFVKYRKEMKGLDWCAFYNKYKDNKYNATEYENRIVTLFDDDDVTSYSGIYLYLLSGEEKHLSIRAFDKRMIRYAYEIQKGFCKKCNKHFELDEMQADHITPWSKGGKTIKENCQMLCADCNRRKSDI